MNATAQVIALDIAGLAFVAVSIWALVTGHASVWQLTLPISGFYLGVKVPTPG